MVQLTQVMKIPKLIQLLLYLFFTHTTMGQDLYPLMIKKEGKFGFIDSTGKLIISNRFDNANEFQQGLACTKTLGKWGIIDKKGAYISKGRYEKFLYSFTEGIALFQNGDTLIYVNKKGEEVIKEKLEKDLMYGRRWSEGYHAFKRGGKWGIVDTSGQIIIPAQYDVLRDVQGGLMYVEFLPENEYYTFTDNKGNIFKTRNIDSLNNLDPCYHKMNRYDIGWMVDLKNQKVLKLPHGYNFFGYNEGWMSFTQVNGRYTYVDKQGKLFGKEYDEAYEFKDGIANIAIHTGQMEHNGVNYDTLHDKCSGEVFYADDPNNGRKQNFINLQGKLLNNELYDGTTSFRGDMAVVIKNKIYGAINKEGKYILPLKYEDLVLINSKLCKYKMKGKWGLMDRKANLITPPEFEDFDFSGNHLAFKTKGKWGIMDNGGKILIQPTLDYVLYIIDSLGIVGYVEGEIKNDIYVWDILEEFSKGTTKLKLGYLRLDSSMIWQPTN